MAAVDIPSLRASALGTTAMLFETDRALSHAVQKRVWAVAAAAAAWAGVREAVPGMNNLMLVFDPRAISAAALAAQVAQAWTEPPEATQSTRQIDIAVTYGGDRGPDLQHVAERAGLSVDDVIDLHTAATYTVYFLGAHPGFAYMGGLDARIHTPRRAEPRLKVLAGSVAIGGAQAGVVAQTSPSGWQLIGHTERTFFDPARSEPALLLPGDEVRFRALGRAA